MDLSHALASAAVEYTTLSLELCLHCCNPNRVLLRRDCDWYESKLSSRPNIRLAFYGVWTHFFPRTNVRLRTQQKKTMMHRKWRDGTTWRHWVIASPKVSCVWLTAMFFCDFARIHTFYSCWRGCCLSDSVNMCPSPGSTFWVQPK